MSPSVDFSGQEHSLQSVTGSRQSLCQRRTDSKAFHIGKWDGVSKLTQFAGDTTQLLSQNELALLDMARARLRGKLKHPLPDEVAERYRTEVTELTARMREVRREIKLCDAIEERSDLMREKLKAIAEAEHQKIEQQKRKSRPRYADGR